MNDWLIGKRTYIVAGITFVLGGLQALGVIDVPASVWAWLGAAGLGALRAGVKRV